MADTTLNLTLHPAQIEIFKSPERFVAVAAGRRFGKSRLAAVRAICKAMEPANVHRAPAWLITPVQPQAKRIYWRLLNDLAHPLIIDRHVNDGEITLEGDRVIGIKGADRPDTMRGVGLWDATLDEFATMKPEVWEQIIRPALADYSGTALFIGTPFGRNHFYQICQEAMREMEDATIAEIDKEWRYFHFTSHDNPYLDPKEIEKARSTMSAAAFRQEFLASFETGSTDLLPLDKLKYVDEEPKDAAGKELPGQWYVACDLAGFADVAKNAQLKMKRLDQTALAIVKIFDDGRWFVKEIVFGRWGVEETAKRLAGILEHVRPSGFGIEKGALLNAVEPYLRNMMMAKGLPLRITPLSHENKSKVDRVTWALQGRAENGTLLLQRGAWNKEFEDQWSHFPSKLVHDDLIDALAYIAQLIEGLIFGNFGTATEERYWQELDPATGW